MPEEDAWGPRSAGTRRLDVLVVLLGKNGAADDAGDAGDDSERQREHDRLKRRPDRLHDDEQQQQRRERDRRVYSSLDQRIDKAAEVARDDPEDHPDRRASDDADEGDGKGNAAAIDNAAEDVAAEALRPEDVG